MYFLFEYCGPCGFPEFNITSFSFSGLRQPEGRSGEEEPLHRRSRSPLHHRRPRTGPGMKGGGIRGVLDILGCFQAQKYNIIYIL
jgi:hypothetical protein